MELDLGGRKFGKLEIERLNYKPEPKRATRRWSAKSRIPGSNEIRRIHQKGQRLAVPK